MRWLPGAGRKREGQRRVEMRQSREDDRQRRPDDADPQKRSELADNRNAAVEQDHGGPHCRHREERAVGNRDVDERGADARDRDRNAL